MAFTFFNNREPRQFNYKPRYYDPKKEESTGDARKDFEKEQLLDNHPFHDFLRDRARPRTLEILLTPNLLTY